jgi:prefoldin subunit 5
MNDIDYQTLLSVYQKKVSEFVNQVIIYEAKITSLSSTISELTIENEKLKKPKRGVKSEGDFE